MPLNYLEGDPSRQTINQIHIDYSNRSSPAVDLFGQHSQSCFMNLTPADPDLFKDYHGDVIVRKFPYDPNHPFFDTSGIGS